MHNVFVYGTLKSNFPNHHHIEAGKLKGAYKTLQRYPLYLEGERYSPWLVDEQGQGAYINGEVYIVNEALLTKLDLLERTHLSDGYLRKQITVLDDKGKADSAFCYFKRAKDTANAMIRTPMFEEYTLEHANLYIARNL